MEIQDLYDLLKHCNKVSVDSRTIEPGDIFFAINGINTNGNIFARDAINKGAKYVVIDDPQFLEENKKFILVKNALLTLQRLAKLHRNKFDIPIIGITGSCGKTMTKELVKIVLSTKYKTYASYGNLNSHIGLPMTLLSMPLDTEIGIFELGARGFGEIDELCSFLNPTHGLITSIKEVHLDGFGNINGVLSGKLELYDYLAENNGQIFININESKLFSAAHKYKNVIYYSSYPKAIEEKIYFKCKLIKTNNVFISYEDEKGNIIETKILGDFNINNIASALCIAKFFLVPTKLANKAIQNYESKNNRLEIIQKKSNTILLDAYNSNFDSLSGAISILKKFDNLNKVLILGELKEMGTKTSALHKKVIELTRNPMFNEILFCGEEFYKHKDLNPKAYYFENKSSLEDFLNNNKFIDSAILIKASRSFQFETLLDNF